jgi:N-acetylglucosamine-6-phosphate deacetylase
MPNAPVFMALNSAMRSENAVISVGHTKAAYKDAEQLLDSRNTECNYNTSDSQAGL